MNEEEIRKLEKCEDEIIHIVYMNEEEIRKEEANTYKNNIDFIEYIKVKDKLSNTGNAIVYNNELTFKNIDFFKNVNISNNIKYCNEIIPINELFIDPDSNQISKIKKITFNDCRFFKDFKCSYSLEYSLEFFGNEFKTFISLSGLAKNDTVIFHKNNIERLTISMCEFGFNFYINAQNNNNEEIKINSLRIINSKFNENFKIHNCIIEHIQLDGINFEKNADFFKSKFVQKNKDIIFTGINVQGMTILEECEFSSKFIMEYMTFENLVQFRGAIFEKGLNLDKTNISNENEMNFFKSEGLDKDNSIKNTSQETYRIIKFNCERIGNIIDSNKYHALELEKKRKELSIINFGEWLIFNINYITSKFSTNWYLPILWILVLGVYTAYAINWKLYGVEKLLEIPKLSYLCSNQYFYDLYDGLKVAFKYMSIIKLDDFKDAPIMFVINKVGLGYLYYQFVTAVRKDTRK